MNPLNERTIAHVVQLDTSAPKRLRRYTDQPVPARDWNDDSDQSWLGAGLLLLALAGLLAAVYLWLR